MLDGVRVVDRTTDIAGPYCTKLFTDAGAEVVKVEPPDGDPLRRWRSGGLFEYLNAGKRSITGDDTALVQVADVLVTDRQVDADALWRHNQALVMVTITPFGCDGPWADWPATEFTLQALCGSTGFRGLPEAPPLAAGGRLGEWITGTYAAVAGAAALRSARASGCGELVDVAMLDCMAVTMVSHPSLFAAMAGWPPQRGTGRSIEVPSIEPTADGYVVFTTNSAQQHKDFCTLIGREDLLADAELGRALHRFLRRDEFRAAVWEHTTKLTTAEVLDEAARLRVPAGPVLNGATVTAFAQFAERGVFVQAPSGRFRQPRVPYRISGVSEPRFRPAPAVSQDDGTIAWPPRQPGAVPDRPWQLPLTGIRVVDCTAWWAGPAATHVLAGLGADVIKVESATRPDLMRYVSVKPPTDDRFYEWGPLFHAANGGKRAVTIDLRRPEGVEVFERLLGTADVMVENYTPRVMDQFGLTWERVHAVNPALVMVRMPAFGLDGPWRDRTGFAQTMECVAGMAWVTGFADRPPVLVRGACDPLAGMHAVLATLMALAARERDHDRGDGGGGRLVEVAMIEAALNAAAEPVIEHEVAGTVLSREGNRGPVAAPQGVYACAGEDRWLALAVATDAQWRALRGVLDTPAWSRDPELDSDAGRRAAHDRMDAELAAWCAGQDADELASRLVGAGVPAGVVLPAREAVYNPQLQHRRLLEVEDHPVTGRHEIAGLPFRYSRVERWITRPAPVLGEHNGQVLGQVASPAELEALRAAGVIGERLTG